MCKWVVAQLPQRLKCTFFWNFSNWTVLKGLRSEEKSSKKLFFCLLGDYYVTCIHYFSIFLPNLLFFFENDEKTHFICLLSPSGNLIDDKSFWNNSFKKKYFLRIYFIQSDLCFAFLTFQSETPAITFGKLA